MNLGSICKRHVVTIDRQATLQEAARRMRDQHVGALVVTHDGPEGRRVEGLLTDRDLAIEVLASDLPGARQQAVAELVGGTLVSATESTGLTQAIDLMRAAGVRRLLVRDEQGRLAGIVSFDDLLQSCAEQLAGLADVVRKGLQREAAERAEVAGRTELPLLTLHLPAASAAASLAAAMGTPMTAPQAAWPGNGIRAAKDPREALARRHRPNPSPRPVPVASGAWQAAPPCNPHHLAPGMRSRPPPWPRTGVRTRRAGWRPRWRRAAFGNSDPTHCRRRRPGRHGGCSHASSAAR